MKLEELIRKLPKFLLNASFVFLSCGCFPGGIIQEQGADIPPDWKDEKGSQKAICNVYDLEKQEKPSLWHYLWYKEQVAALESGTVDASDLDSRFESAIFYGTITYRKAGLHDKIVNLMTKYLELKPDCQSAYDIRGWAFYRLQRYEDALTDFKKAYSIYPNPVYFSNFAQVKQALKRYKEAAEDYQRYLAHNPNDKEAKKRLEECLAKLD